MTFKTPMMGLMLRHPVSVATTPFVAALAILEKLSRKESMDQFPGQDPEIGYWEIRGNWVLHALQQTGPQQCLARFIAAQKQAASMRPDAYSAAQRIANAAYLLQAIPDQERGGAAELIGEALARDARYLCCNPEHGRITPWFNNHLLNDYRAAVLGVRQAGLIQAFAELGPFAARIGAKIERHIRTLFGSDAVLLEGSVSYELLGLKHIVDSACSGFDDSFGRKLRAWAQGPAKATAMVYRKADRWLIPQIGDCSPDWDPETMHIFLNGFALGHDTVYRRIWRTELSALGL